MSSTATATAGPSAVRVCSPQVGLAPESSSGGEVYEREILKHLASLGVRIELILPRSASCWADVPNWHVHRTWLPKGFRWYISNPVFAPYIKRVYDQSPFDMLRVHSVRFTGPAALWARSRYHLPVPVVAHHHHVDRNRLNVLIERRVIEASDLVITGSHFSRAQLAGELEVRTDHVAVVYDGISRDFSPQPRDEVLAAKLGLQRSKTLLFVGGLKPRKNLDLLLRIFRRVLEAHGDGVRLVIAGTGSEARALRRLARSLGIANQVTFTGYVPEADKVRLYNVADIYVHPSKLEGFGLTVGEAMSCARPVVASRAGALPEVVVEGETGVLCEPDDAESFGRAILQLLEDPALARAMGAAGAQRVERMFRWEQTARSTASLYEDAVRRWQDGQRNRESWAP